MNDPVIGQNRIPNEAYAELQPTIARALRDKHFYEWYSRDNKLNGSSDFKGSAGELALAIEVLKGWAKNHPDQ